MNVDVILTKLESAKDYAAKHIVIISIVLIVLLFGFMVVRIYLLSTAEPTQSQVDEKSGALIFDYPIEVPPGRNEFTPEVHLTYNSQNRDTDSVIGH